MWNHKGNQSWFIMKTSKFTVGYLWATLSNWSVSESLFGADWLSLSCLLNTWLDSDQLALGTVSYGLSTLSPATVSGISPRRQSHREERIDPVVVCFYSCWLDSFTVISSAAALMLELWRWTQTRWDTVCNLIAGCSYWFMCKRIIQTVCFKKCFKEG